LVKFSQIRKIYETDLENASEQAHFVVDVSAGINVFSNQVHNKMCPDSHQSQFFSYLVLWLTPGIVIIVILSLDSSVALNFRVEKQMC
jgi:hypothetical protein